ncbi:translocation protein Sec62-domain-containing protein [Chytridium lagenaria]|nr:translocation protein Sec62-domain-containing protein [Chytridium lagenaria]
MRSAESKLKIRQGILNGRRVDFFKGKHAANALLRDPYKKSPARPAIPDREAAEKLLSELLTLGFFIRVEKESKSKVLSLQQLQVFGPEAFYVWVYEGSQWRGTLIGLGVLMLTLAGVMFPLWPASMRLGVYYLSLAVLGLMGLFMGLAVVRLIIWVVLVATTGRGGWLFPNLFADVGIVESFIPTWRYSQ